MLQEFQPQLHRISHNIPCDLEDSRGHKTKADNASKNVLHALPVKSLMKTVLGRLCFVRTSYIFFYINRKESGI